MSRLLCLTIGHFVASPHPVFRMPSMAISGRQQTVMAIDDFQWRLSTRSHALSLLEQLINNEQLLVVTLRFVMN